MARPRVHLAASLALGACQWARTGALLPAVAPLLTGFLVDADHLLDHRLHAHRRRQRADADVQVLPLHGWEYLGLLALVEARWLGRSTRWGLLLGLAVHLGIDQLSNGVRDPLTYFVLHRASRGFRGRFFAGEPEQHAWRRTPLLRLWRWL